MFTKSGNVVIFSFDEIPSYPCNLESNAKHVKCNIIYWRIKHVSGEESIRTSKLEAQRLS